MGKYMKKSKITGDILAVMEVSPQSSQGVRTRAAKRLALQRLHKPSSLPAVVSRPEASPSSYLQLRSRRLEKAPVLGQQQKAQHSSACCGGRSSPVSFRNSSRLRQDSANSVSEKQSPGLEVENSNIVDFGASFCEDNLHLGVENRSTPENPPSSLVRESDIVETPESRLERELHGCISSSSDIEEFFADEELWHQRMFVEKYNFDFANDMPLQGRYEWMQMVP